MATSGYGLQSELFICRTYPAKACKELHKIENEGRRWKMQDRRWKMEDRRWETERLKKIEHSRQKLEDRRYKMEKTRWKIVKGGRFFNQSSLAITLKTPIRSEELCQFMRRTDRGHCPISDHIRLEIRRRREHTERLKNGIVQKFQREFNYQISETESKGLKTIQSSLVLSVHNTLKRWKN